MHPQPFNYSGPDAALDLVRNFLILGDPKKTSRAKSQSAFNGSFLISALCH